MRLWKLWCSAKTAVRKVKRTSELLEGFVCSFLCQSLFAFFLNGFVKRFLYTFRYFFDVGRIVCIFVMHMLENIHHARHAVCTLFWKICSGKKRYFIGRHDDCQWLSTVSGHHLTYFHVN